tara:strand:+ start:348 stop:563 length:216 start_codon:yes stop_codon:yes gene_type:complete
MKKIKVLGIKKILIFDLEYLTKLSVKIEIDKTSINLEIEYKKGIIKGLCFTMGDLIKFVRHSTSRQHKLRP